MRATRTGTTRRVHIPHIFIVSGHRSIPLGKNKAYKELVSRLNLEGQQAKGIVMPKRKGYIWEELTDLNYCEQCILIAIANKRKTPFLNHVKENYKEYGHKLQQTLINGWEPSEVRLKTINEGTDAKKRELKIPTLRDHFVHTAVAKILEKYLQKRFYFYACGSLPNRGQTFAVKAVEGYMRKKKPKYCAVADIKKCYASIKKELVMRCLRKIFKDERFLRINEMILEQMGDGLAIGFTVSHWYAHLVLSFIDERLKRISHLFLVRYMDNFVLMCGRKRTLHRAINYLKHIASKYWLEVKHDWQVFPIKKRMLLFLSYRLNHDKTILRKPLMYKMSRRFRRARIKMDAHCARTIMSYRGILKHCDSYNFRKRYLYPNVSINLCRRLISDADKKRVLLRTA